MKERKDIWLPEQDAVIVDIVLEHIRTGSTQLAAFEEAARQLGRTSSAVSFRWNAKIRDKHEKYIALAKRENQERKLKKKAEAKLQKQQSTANASVAETICPAWITAEKFGISEESTSSEITTVTGIIEQMKQFHRYMGHMISRVEKEFEEIKKRL